MFIVPWEIMVNVLFFTPSLTGNVDGVDDDDDDDDDDKVDERSGYYVPTNNGVNPFTDPRNEL